MIEKKFVDWIPVMVEHRPYDTECHIQNVIGCHGCKGCFKVWNTTQYPRIGRGGYQPREVCDSCLEDDKKSGVFDAIMDIWNNYEEV